MARFKFRRCVRAAVTLAASAFVSGAGPSAGVVGTPGATPRVVNVTTDSTPGWLPSPELEEQAKKTAVDFMAAMDGGRYAEAYAFLAEIDRKDQTLSDFSNRVRQFNSGAGAVIERRITTITWTKNPAHAPLPGIYAALDLVSRFANIDRHCGFVVLYRAPSEQSFKVMREENYFLENAAVSSAQPSAVEKMRANLSAHCPNYQRTSVTQQMPANSSEPLPEASGPTIGYPNVAAALAALHSKDGVVFRTENGWTIAEEAASKTIWSFPQPGNPAYPAAVKRQVVEEGGSVSIKMAVQCEATKQACDDLVRSFEQLNAQMSASTRGR
jgi:Protein of unknown function (DUF4019)